VAPETSNTEASADSMRQTISHCGTELL
jgi:hypothetical protein